MLFLHIVPMMAAVAVLPHFQRKTIERSAWDLLICCCCSRGGFIFICLSSSPGNMSTPSKLNTDAALTCSTLGTPCADCWRDFGLAAQRGRWRGSTATIWSRCAVLHAGSILASLAIDYHLYYTGSLYDVPLVAAMAWFAAWGSWRAELRTMGVLARNRGTGHGIWKARLAMVGCVFHTADGGVGGIGGARAARVRSYRLLLTVAAMV